MCLGELTLLLEIYAYYLTTKDRSTHFVLFSAFFCILFLFLLRTFVRSQPRLDRRDSVWNALCVAGEQTKKENTHTHTHTHTGHKLN